MSVVDWKQRTYTAKLFEAAGFKIAGTLDGYIDLATSNGTYQMSVAQALMLVAALHGAVADINENCLYDRDALLEKP